jgi:hypothetical protein
MLFCRPGNCLPSRVSFPSGASGGEESASRDNGLKDAYGVKHASTKIFVDTTNTFVVESRHGHSFYEKTYFF